MALLDWKDEFSVEVQSIDNQHKKLFGMLNELFEAMRAGKGSQVAPTIVKNLVAYTREHFANEEKMMLQAGYPQYAAHKVEHDKLTAEVAKMVQELESGKLAVSVQLLDFLKKWLQSHILSTDKKYSAHMRAAGIR
jgi:hemerythrin